MIVNLRGAKWHVTTFVEQHNHLVYDKFELKKFLRSHRSIPNEERKFVELLHQANISSGRIMEIMSEIYGGYQFTPFVTKNISNLKVKLGKGTKYKDMVDTLAHFEELKKSDLDFYYKIDLDEKD
ncbi:hypothetical protein BS78_05G161000 [Paspalum vaginatum]|nr:hypothetical protein BS78_05G161000 [Paspalum vaginatum]